VSDRAIRLPPPYTLIAFDEIDSTNAEARRRADAGAAEGTLIVARRQSAGRGRRGREWVSPDGNLYMSLILRPDQALESAANLSFVAAVAMAEALAGLVPPMVAISLKWPNDVLIHGHKCAGLLLESAARTPGTLDWLVVGIGVNVSSHPDDVPYPATDLAHEGAVDVTPEAVVEAFARHFLRWSDRWVDEGFTPVRAAWLAMAHGLGEAIDVRLEEETIHGVFKGLDDDGTLLVTLEDGGTRRVVAGDVFPVSR
jgi:BirA family biotin operon repressor/biotin-[acetyl-CoA-carboxylase] ligase